MIGILKRHWIMSLVTFLLIVVLSFCYFLFSATVTSPQGVVYYLQPGTSKKSLITELNNQGVLRHAWIFSLYVGMHSKEVLKSGEYVFPQGASLVNIWHQVTTGKGLLEHPFLIVPGWTFHQVRLALDRSEPLDHLTTTLSDEAIMARLGYPHLSPEGQFYPDTYFFTRGVSDVTLLKHAFTRMQQKFSAAWAGRASLLPYQSAFEALIAASLIEKEAYLDKERPVIAGVLVNRLTHHMLLQIDPTVIYGLGDRYQGKLYKSDLEQESPYNTYLHEGLPPTPIAMPGMPSIQAALHPEMNNFYYYVAKGDGSHQFSQTLVQHEAAIHTIKKEMLKQGANHASQ